MALSIFSFCGLSLLVFLVHSFETRISIFPVDARPEWAPVGLTMLLNRLISSWLPERGPVNDD